VKARRRVNSTVRRNIFALQHSMNTCKLNLTLLIVLLANASSCGSGGVGNHDYSQRLVHDKRDGRYIGVLRGECRFFDREKGKDIITYKVEQSDGKTVEISSERVTVTEQ
jgi:hypothetical protein